MNSELQKKIDRMKTVLGRADAEYKKLLEERRLTGTVRKYTAKEMEQVLHLADENYLHAIAERPPSQHKVVHIDSRRSRHSNLRQSPQYSVVH